MSATDSPDKRPWKGRFTEATEPSLQQFSASVHFDRRLYRYDIEGSLAHAQMLNRIGLLSDEERHRIIVGLEEIRDEIERGEFHWDPALEDVHMNIETVLIQKIGACGGKLHTARSRNDQVATDLRLFLRDACDALQALLRKAQQTLIDLAERECETVMPGFTHLQVAQPVSFGHHVMAWQEMLRRDRQRVADCRKRVDVSPLGAAALAGTSHPIDPQFTAAQLGFSEVFENSLDAVSDRDFAIEFCSCAALLMVHLSRIAEELILWNSQLCGFVRMPDRFCTGSSIMPQKKNPDLAELIRGKAARVQGNLSTLMILMKAQPLAYNRDNQEDKLPLFDTVDTARDCLGILIELFPVLELDHAALREAAERGYATATELADYLVRLGVPFRDAHEITGRVVGQAAASGRRLSELSLDELRQHWECIGEDVYAALDPERAMAAHNHRGATAPAQVRAAIARARAALEE